MLYDLRSGEVVGRQLSGMVQGPGYLLQGDLVGPGLVGGQSYVLVGGIEPDRVSMCQAVRPLGEGRGQGFWLRALGPLPTER
jgi:hypothetical protein